MIYKEVNINNYIYTITLDSVEAGSVMGLIGST